MKKFLRFTPLIIWVVIVLLVFLSSCERVPTDGGCGDDVRFVPWWKAGVKITTWLYTIIYLVSPFVRSIRTEFVGENPEKYDDPIWVFLPHYWLQMGFSEGDGPVAFALVYMAFAAIIFFGSWLLGLAMWPFMLLGVVIYFVVKKIIKRQS